MLSLAVYYKEGKGRGGGDCVGGRERERGTLLVGLS